MALLLAIGVAVADCGTFRQCTFGQKSVYDATASWMASVSNASLVCQADQCMTVHAALALEYRPAPGCESATFISNQHNIISRCGTVAGVCCGSGCTVHNIDRPILPRCKRRPTFDHVHRVWTTSYAIAGTLLWYLSEPLC